MSLLYGDARKRREETARAFHEASGDRRRAWRRAGARAKQALGRPPALVWLFNAGLLTGLAPAEESGGRSPLGIVLRTASVVRLLGNLGGPAPGAEAAAGEEAVGEAAGAGLESVAG